jgi:hypothetical protein
VALEPFRRKIGIPGAAPLVPVRTVAMPDIGGQIAAAGQSFFAAGEPERQQKAIEAGEIAAAQTEVRQPDGTLISQAPDVKGGVFKQEAFNRLIEAKYLTEFNADLQKKADELAGKYIDDPLNLIKIGDAYKESAVSVVPLEFRDKARELANREFQERYRSTSSSFVSRQRASEVKGIYGLIQTGVKNYDKLLKDPNSTPEQRQAVKDETINNAYRLKEYGASDEEVNSILQANQFDFTIADEYALSVENSFSFMDWANASISPDDLRLAINWLEGVNTPGTLGGTVSGGVKKIDATPDIAQQKLESLFPNAKINSGPRPPDHPLSIENPKSAHNTVNGGRAFDVAPIPGMTFDEYISRVKKAGFNVIQPIDETTPEAMKKYGSTGKNWHFSYGPTINEKSTAQDSAASQLTFEKLHEMFPSATVRSSLQQTLGMRVTDINTKEAEDAAADRAAREAAKLDQVIGAIKANAAGGIYNYSLQDIKILNTSFDQRITELGGLNTEEGRAASIDFLSNYAFMPSMMKASFTANLRNPNLWKGSLDLYNSVEVLTTKTGSNMGDVLIGSLPAKDVALLRSALSMQKAGLDEALIGAQIENFRKGTAYTAPEAQVQFNNIRGKDAYRKSKGRALKDLFGIDGVLPKDLSLNYDEAFAANLAIYGNDLDEAVEATREQLRSVSVANPIFKNGVGNKRVINLIGGSGTAFNQILMNHLSTLTIDNGEPLMKKVDIGGGRMAIPVVGGANSTVEIEPIDGNINQIGRYQITVFDPAKRKVIRDRFVIDFSKDLNPQIQAYTRRQRAGIDASDKAGIEAARQQKVEDRKTFERAKRQSQTVSGPKL